MIANFFFFFIIYKIVLSLVFNESYKFYAYVFGLDHLLLLNSMAIMNNLITSFSNALAFFTLRW
jgi:hypothetical protein